MPGMKLITVNIPKKLLKLLDELVKDKKYPNRAEAIRFAVHDLLWSEGKI